MTRVTLEMFLLFLLVCSESVVKLFTCEMCGCVCGCVCVCERERETERNRERERGRETEREREREREGGGGEARGGWFVNITNFWQTLVSVCFLLIFVL